MSFEFCFESEGLHQSVAGIHHPVQHAFPVPGFSRSARKMKVMLSSGFVTKSTSGLGSEPSAGTSITLPEVPERGD